MKHTRALSSGNIFAYESIRKTYLENSPDKPIHRPVQSLFTNSSGFTNFRGLVNLGSFLLLITTSRMALQNVIKYGIVIDPFSWIRFLLNNEQKFAVIGLLVCCNVFILFAWLLERAVVRGLVSPRIAFFFNCWNIFCVMAFPTTMILSLDFNPLFSSPVLIVYSVLSLKLWSYAAVNRWCRESNYNEDLDKIELLLHELTKQSGTGRKELKYDERKSNKHFKKFDENDPAKISGNQDMSFNSPDHDLSSCQLDSNLKSKKIDFHTNSNEIQSNHLRSCRSFSIKKESESSKQSIEMKKNQKKVLKNLKPFRHSESNNTMALLTMDPVEHEVNNFVCRETCEEFSRQLYITYPNNLTLKDIYYFILAPTLCYELNFPRTLAIRKSFLLKRLFELVFITQLILCLTQQWVLPTLRNSLTPFGEANLSLIIERCLKLAIPNHLIWLLAFYTIFHAFLNLTGEILRFGDRFFYSDWWNAESVSAFWSKWNIPVHRFARRHIYVPLLNIGCTRFQAGMVVFFVSAFFHELLVSVPLKMPRFWAFWGMFGQMPYAFLVSYLFPNGGTCGNLAVWLTLILGQPLAILFYFHDYYIIHFTT